MRWPYTFTLFALTIGARPTSGQQTAGRIEGTYRIAVCKRTPCSPLGTTGAAASGTLVLLDSAISLDTLPEGARRFLRSPYLDGPPNACFKLLRSFVPSQSWAGIAPIGLTQWATDSTGSVTFTLYRSPDAIHTVSAVVRGDTLRGTGKSVGFGAVEVHWPRDTVIAVRVGPPSIAPCVEAAMQEHYLKPPPPTLRPARGSGRPLHQ